MKKTITVILGLIATVLLISRFILPNPVFNLPYSTVLYDRSGELLGARIADDEQWRFPEIEELNKKMKLCMLQSEDRYFYIHPGVNPVSIFRAIKINIQHGEIRQGGSTLTMQLARLWYENPPRTLSQKSKKYFWPSISK